MLLRNSLGAQKKNYMKTTQTNNMLPLCTKSEVQRAHTHKMRNCNNLLANETDEKLAKILIIGENCCCFGFRELSPALWLNMYAED